MAPKLPRTKAGKFARKLRANTTDAEQKMWRALKSLPLRGTHFRRQVPIGSYVVDFVCMRERIIVEIDGGQHSEEANIKKDAARTHWLEREGYI